MDRLDGSLHAIGVVSAMTGDWEDDHRSRIRGLPVRAVDDLHRTVREAAATQGILPAVRALRRSVPVHLEAARHPPDRIGDMTRELREIFEQAGCEGALCVRPVQGDGEIALNADRPAVQASVFKVQIALEVETAFADGRLDGRERVTLGAAERTDGPVGMSLFEDETVLSLRDLVVLMLTISDNPATDVLLGRVGVDAVNATAARLGLSGTLVTSDLRTMLDTIGEDLGRADWADLQSWAAGASAADQVWVDEQLPTVRAMDPSRGTRTTPRDMVALLRLIWTDRAGPAAACARVRGAMARQLTRHRIGSGFRPPVRVAAKSGSLFGVVRNEVGVVSFPDGRQYAAAVFTRSRPGSDDAEISRAIGAATARAVTALREVGS
ncbi:serine hydrolase [Kitasatospora griseola]|uniref:serine hydrolase n=1 Tax=Kitasatospora griseola TaxID=2064 RepID=UPI0038558DCB